MNKLLFGFIVFIAQTSIAGGDRMPNFMRAASCCSMDGDENACMVKDLLPKFNVADMKCNKNSDDPACEEKKELQEQITTAAEKANENCNKPLF